MTADTLTCPVCLAYGLHLYLDAETIDCYDCSYVGVPERYEWSGLCHEYRMATLAHANDTRARDSAEVRTLLETIDDAMAAHDLDDRDYINTGVNRLENMAP